MAEELFNPEGIALAEEGGDEVRGRLAELEEGAVIEVDSIIRFLRQIPATDKAKKRELEKFFQTPDGQRYTKEERKQKYDELLGVERNRETIG